MNNILVCRHLLQVFVRIKQLLKSSISGSQIQQTISIFRFGFNKIIKSVDHTFILKHNFSQHKALLAAPRTASISSNKFNHWSSMKFNYPDVRRDETVVDDYHGVKVPDPYRWLEDPDSDDTKKFVKEQNSVTQPFLENCEVRSKVHQRLTKLWNYPKYSCPYRHGNKYFFYLNKGLQNQSVLYVQDGLKGEPKVFLDPNELSPDGTISLTSRQFSEDDKIFAYGLSQSGSDWYSIHFKDVETGKDYPETLEKVKISTMTWTQDNKGLFYGRYPDQEIQADGSKTNSCKNQKLYYHRVNTPQSEDVLTVEFPNEPSWVIGAEVSECGNYLIVTPRKDCKDNLLYFCDLRTLPNNEIKDKLTLVPIIEKYEADYDYITNDGPIFIFRTNKDAPNYRLIKIDINNPSPDKWTTLVPQHPSDVLDWTSAVCEDKLVLCYIHDVKSLLQVHDLHSGTFLKTLPLGMGTVTGFSGRRKYKEIFYGFTSFLSPGIIYTCDLSTTDFVPSVYREIKIEGFDTSSYETTQVFFKSKDGTKIPMFIIKRKGLVKNGQNPCLLYGYGGFNVSLQPTFSITRLVFIQHFEGVLAIANLRGGGEYGERWHDAGRLFNKQNVFDDFHSAAETLVKDGYTNNQLLAIQGGSNGGLLVAACANQRPDLYASVIAQVGVLDMLRYHKFTIASMWASDYGSSDDPKHFQNLFKYSPLHNIREPEQDGVQYPATLLFTADHDDRVVPLHSYKFIATLQHTLKDSKKQTKPVMIVVETKAGHGGGKPTTKVINENTDLLVFLIKTLGVKYVE